MQVHNQPYQSHLEDRDVEIDPNTSPPTLPIISLLYIPHFGDKTIFVTSATSYSSKDNAACLCVKCLGDPAVTKVTGDHKQCFNNFHYTVFLNHKCILMWQVWKLRWQTMGLCQTHKPSAIGIQKKNHIVNFWLKYYGALKHSFIKLKVQFLY